MRNPDPWNPGEHDPAPGTRRAALIGLVLVVMLIIAGFVLTRVLDRAARLQDCALSGRSNCSGGS